MTNTKTKIEAIINTINEMDSQELVELNNTYCQSANYSDSEIYLNDEEFFEVFFNGKVLEAVRAVSYGDYNYSHEWVKFNGYGNLESFNYMEAKDLVEAVSTMAEYIADNEEDFEGIFNDLEFDEEN